MTKTTAERAVRGGTVGSATIMPDKDENVLTIPPDFKLSVLMPVYNERKIILKVIARAQAVAIPKEIIIDDGSTNGTFDILRQEVMRNGKMFRLFFINRTKGKALPFQEMPISHQPCTHAEGKKSNWRDAVQSIRWMIRYRFRD